ncbi:ATP-binding protein [Arthrobacter sp. zg-Y1143]|uniref:sensor histidine kinase n=1 Tax=Arthrobacter sp. zg-Y1143 TaxID=3049065 RepID=UPI0024C403D1|nr:ATP-binding protein [Arthrobacter sp. zg-Y1143]MDK1328166.1 ATP-binding protein [Arthrobacter sp. zg-Y1143]
MSPALKPPAAPTEGVPTMGSASVQEAAPGAVPTDGAARRYTALVAVQRPDVFSVTAGILAAAGLEPVAVRDLDGAVASARAAEPVLAVVDSRVRRIAGMDLLKRLRHEVPALTKLPVILVADEAGLDIDLMVELGIADFVASPVDPDDLTRRVDLMLATAEAHRGRRMTAARLREATRRISASIRATNDPQQMSEVVVHGLGETFQADHVFLMTFPDERVPELALSWSREGTTGSIPALAGSTAVELAEKLWARGRGLAVEDHRQPDGDEPVPLSPASLAAGLGTSMIVPLGHGDKAFGLVWLAGERGPRDWTSTETSLIQHASGNLAHGLVQGNLITAQRMVLKRLRELDQAKTDFVATVNHELRTPLTSITGYLDLILDGSGGDIPADVADMLKIVGRNAVRLNQLITDLLTISRQDADEGTLDVEEVDLHELLQAVAASLAPAAGANNLDLRLELGPDPLCVDGDSAALEQVFTNLCSNAVKFTPAGGSVLVRAELVRAEGAGPSVRVQITDTGIGIPEAELPNLFRRFFRASNATSAAIPGTGLGLAIVQDIVLQHGGELGVESKVGSGTTATVLLPAGR